MIMNGAVVMAKGMNIIMQRDGLTYEQVCARAWQSMVDRNAMEEEPMYKQACKHLRKLLKKEKKK